MQDSYTNNGKKKTLENIAEVLRFLIKREEKDDAQDLQRNGTADDKRLEGFLDDSNEVNDLTVKDEVAQTIADFSEEVSRIERDENSAEENDRVSDKDYVISDDDNDNAKDEDYKPTGRVKKDVKGAKKRKQGFKLRIRQSKKAAEAEERKDEVGEEDSSNKDVQVKTKRAKKRKNRTVKKIKIKDLNVNSDSSSSKRRRQSDENVTYATNVHCFICEDETVLYPTEDDFFEHCLKEHVDHSEERKVLIPCNKCEKTFRVSTFRAGKSYMRTPVYTLLNHLVDKHGLMRPEWAPVYK